MTDIPNITPGIRIRMIILDLITAPIIKIPIVGILLTVSIKDGIIEIIRAKWQ